jgi:hypothetical protein
VSNLQLGLLVLGALVIGGVYLFNRLQERRYRTQAEEVFRRDHPDVLLDNREPAAPAPSTAQDAGLDNEAPPLTRAKRVQAEQIEPSLRLDPIAPSTPLDKRIHYVAVLRADAGAPVPAEALMAAVKQFAFTNKPARWQGKNLSDGAWEDIGRGGERAYNHLQVGVQLANRNGALAPNELESFVGMVKNVAASLKLQPELPDKDAALRHAEALDAFCAQVDVVMDYHVACKDGAPLPATRIRALAEAEAMTLRPDGVFVARNEHGEDMFTLSNAEARPFVPDQIRAITTHGVMFSLDVPRVKDVIKALSRMTNAAQKFAHGVDGIVMDERRREVKDTQIQQIRNQLQDIVNTMAKQQIPAGSALAQQLFAE